MAQSSPLVEAILIATVVALGLIVAAFVWLPGFQSALAQGVGEWAPRLGLE